MGIFILGGKNAEKYPTRLKELELQIKIINTILVLPWLIYGARMLYWNRRKKYLFSRSEQTQLVEVFVDYRNLAHRAAVAAAYGFITVLGATENWSRLTLKEAAGAGIAAALSVIKNFVRQKKEIRRTERVADANAS